MRQVLIYLSVAIDFGQFIPLQLRRTIITLTLTLTAFSVSFSQDFKNDIKEGLYLWSSGLVIQQTNDSLKIIQLRVSKSHLYRVADEVYDSITKTGMLLESDPMWDEIKPSDTYRLIKPSKILDILEFSKYRFSIILPADKGFNSVNFIRRNSGYEMYFSNHVVKRKRVKESVRRDTAAYFKLYAFTLNDLGNLKKLKAVKDINQTELEALATVYQDCIDSNVKLFKGNKTFGIALNGIKSNGIIEGRELIIKSLLEIKFNPLIDSNDPDLIYEKLKPSLRPKR